MDKTFLIIPAVLIVGLAGYFLWKEFQPAPTPYVSPENYNSPTENDKIIIRIKNSSFVPANAEIKKAQIISWVNEDSAPHIIASNNFQSSDILNKGDSYEVRFDNIGAFDYICGIHPFMKGEIVVGE